MLNIFCDICIKAIEKGMQPNTHFDKAGWKYEIRRARTFRHSVSIPYYVVNMISCERRKNATNEDPHLEEGSGDSEEDTLPNFVEDVNNMVVDVNFANSSSNPSSSSSSEKRKGMGAQLFSRLDRLVDSVSTRSECTSSGWDKKGCSIEEVMKEFYSIEKVVFGSELYCFATEFFMVRSMREMWAAIGDKERKFQWLKLMFERRSNVKP
ncbi:hypothetical protein BDE02_10G019600 [Populus trichocarpa]|nr:hypothetical protein BDE02_10G019600 [Populus trichocarpa]